MLPEENTVPVWFQSLFFWMMVIGTLTANTAAYFWLFQSLFFWMMVIGILSDATGNSTEGFG